MILITMGMVIVMMARYTEFLKDIMENEETKPLLDKALSTYPLYVKKSKEEYMPSYIPTREELNKKLLNAYKYREIGFETVGRFLDELEIAMNEIMPQYNLLFYSADQDFNPLYNVDYKRTIDTDKNGEMSSNTVGTTSDESESTVDTTTSDDSTTNITGGNYTKNVHSETPQGVLDMSTNNINEIPYADDVTWNSDSNTQNSKTENDGTVTTDSTVSSSGNSNVNTTGTTSDTEKSIETTKGNFGVVSAQDLIAKYRDTILNIEQMIINDERISELFMRVF